MARRPLAFVVSAALTLATATLANGGMATASAVTSTVPCRNLPASPAVLTPQSCAKTDRGLAVAGLATGTSDGEVALFEDQQNSFIRFSSTGALHINSVSTAAVCVAAASGASTGIDPSTATITATTLAACHSGGGLTPSGTTHSLGLAPHLTPQTTVSGATGRTPKTFTTGPAASYSYYIGASNVSDCGSTVTWNCPIWAMGADESVPSGGAWITLDFGAACQDPTTLQMGTQMFGEYTCTSDTPIQYLITRWINGYESTHGPGTPQIILAAGLSNSENGVPGDNQTTSEMASIGDAWARYVVDATGTSGLAAPITMWGGIDAEEASGGWLGPTPTIAFVNQYGTTSGHGSGAWPCTASETGMLADFGDDAGGLSPPGGWTADDVYHVAWGASVACAVPEVYYDVMAKEWENLSNWAVQNGHSAIQFTGVMSENGVNGTETAQQSWDSLANWTNQNVPYLTNIAWSVQTTPAQLYSLPTAETTTAFPVSWQVASGIPGAVYVLFSSQDSGPWLRWLTTTGSQATYYGRAGHHYDFFIETVGSGYNNGGPSSPEASTDVALTATQSEPFKGLYAVDGSGAVRPASSTPVTITGYWGSWQIARALAVNRTGDGGVVVDGFGGLHPFGNEGGFTATAYWPGWDIVRGIALLPNNAGGYVLDGFGGIHPFGSAPSLSTTAYWPGWDIARGIALLPNGTGGYVLDGFGGLHPFGSARAISTTAYWQGWDIARSVVVTPDGTGAYVLDGFGGVHPAGTATAVGPTAYWPGWDIARAVVLEPGSSNSGWTVDGYGGFHAFGSAPGVVDYLYTAGMDTVRGAGAG